MREDMSKMIVERPRWTRFSDDSVPDCLVGLWFAAPYRQCAEEAATAQVYEVIAKQFVPAGPRYAVPKRQLSAQHGLQNDNRIDGGATPQRYKRRRTRS